MSSIIPMAKDRAGNSDNIERLTNQGRNFYWGCLGDGILFLFLSLLRFRYHLFNIIALKHIHILSTCSTGDAIGRDKKSCPADTTVGCKTLHVL